MDAEHIEEANAIPYEEAREAVRAMARRVALLHMSYARVLVDALGEERGKALIAAAIRAYGTRIGERTRTKVEALGLDAHPRQLWPGFRPVPARVSLRDRDRGRRAALARLELRAGRCVARIRRRSAGRSVLSRRSGQDGGV